MPEAPIPSPPWQVIAKPILLWLGVALMALGSADALFALARLHTLVSEPGVVSQLVSSLDASGNVVSTPRVSFDRREEGGGIVVFTPRMGTFSGDLTAGEQVTVAYPKGRPQAAELATIGPIYGWAIAFAIVGMVIFDLGCVLWFLVHEQSIPKTLGPKGPSKNQKAFSAMFRGLRPGR